MDVAVNIAHEFSHTPSLLALLVSQLGWLYYLDRRDQRRELRDRDLINSLKRADLPTKNNRHEQ